ncbi:hypothetical protein KR222_006125 [Zaprionus bogoriensis]|nr:hypothetical protein KR222_006125 [Zaprionus bogoriensis]
MSLNIDMSEIIEFVLPAKSDYSDHNNDGGGGGGSGSGSGGDDDDAESKNHYVVLDAVDVGREYKQEEFLLVNDDDDAEAELLMDNAQLHQQLVNCPELHQAMLRVPKSEPFEEVQYMVTDQNSEDLDDLVEEEELDDVEEGQYEQYEDTIKQEHEHEHEHDLDQYQDHDHEQQVQHFEWNYLQTQSPDGTESEAIESLEAQPRLSPAPRPHSKANAQSLKRGYVLDDDIEAYEAIALSGTTSVTSELATPAASEEPIKLAKPSDKMLDLFKGPRRYMLFDELIATIVDFDEDRTPIVEFSMIGSVQDEKLPVECGICPDVMHKSKLSKHQKTHLVPGTNRYACIYCSETYRDCKYLAGHARRHMGIRPYVCEPCKLYFSTKQDLRVHNQRRHLEKEHICEMCGKTFAQNTQLKRHREATHEKKRRFQCQYCQKAYYKNFSLQEHIRNVHMGKRRMLKCPFCGMQCRDAHKMARHRKEMHLNQDTYVCHLCQEEFTDINYFDAHKRSIQCRSNTRRMVTEDDGDADPDADADAPDADVDADAVDLASRTVNGGNTPFVSESDQLAGILEEDYDEDAGLLVEADADADADAEAEAEAEAEAQAEAEAEANLAAVQQRHEAIYETVNGNYLHEAGDGDGDVDGDQQFVQQYEHNNYDDDSLLVEQLPDEEADHADHQILEDDDEQYLEAGGGFQQHAAAQHPKQTTEYNDDELIYEIILETADN